MICRDEAARCRHGEAILFAHDGEPRPERGRRERRQPDRWPGENERAERRDPMRRCGTGRRERIGRQPADIAVGFELAPGETLLGGFVDHDVLAHQRFGLEPSVGRGRAPDRGLDVDDLVALALDEMRRFDFPP